MKNFKIPEHVKIRIAEILGLKVKDLFWGDYLYRVTRKDGSTYNGFKNPFNTLITASDWNPSSRIDCGQGIHFVCGHPLLMYYFTSRSNARYFRVPIDRIREPVLSSGMEGKIRAKAYRLLKKDEIKRDSQEFSQKLLKKIVFSESNSINVGAVKFITDQRVLKKIVLGDKYYDDGVRIIAIENITDPKVLKKIALEDKNYNVRIVAVEKIRDQKVLKKAALEDEDDEVRIAAIEKITDQKVLGKIALEDEYDEVRIAAVDKITDQKLLKKIALEDEDDDVRIAAQRKIK